MSVDSERDAFHVTRVSPSSLLDRLNAQAYRPAILKAVEDIRSGAWKPLAQIIDGRLTQGLTPEYASSSEICLKTKHVKAVLPEVDFEGTIDPEFARRNRSSQIEAGTVLINRSGAGSIGRTCVYLGSRPVFTNEELFRFRVIGACDPAYVACFFSTWWGERVLEQGVTGATGQLKLAQEFMSDVPVRTASRDAQRYIGSKVRQAEALREWARGMQGAAKSFVEASFTVPTIPSLRERPRKMPVSILETDSLDPNYAVAEQGHRLMASAISIEQMKEACRSGDPIRADERRPGPYPYHGASGPIDWHDDWNIDGNFVLVAQDGSIGRACVVRGRAWANNHVWILTLRPEFDLDAVAFFLNDYYPYWTGLTTGSVVPKVLADNLMRVHVPEVVARAATEVGEPLRRAKTAAGCARALVMASRILVEALIERKITEVELMAAGKDADADRALLARLAEDGLDGVGVPLFSNLDSLAELLAEAQRGGGDS